MMGGMPDPSMDGGMPPMGGDPNMGSNMSDPSMGEDPNMGNEMPPMGGEENPYDSNFDAGVEADEDEDPKRFIQQLTGKLSQSLNKYEEENEDPSTAKYVGKMIIKQVAKGLDDKSKKELIRTLKSDEDEMPEDNEEEKDSDENMPMDDQSMDMQDQGQQPQQPIQENVLTKKQLMEMVLGDNSNDKNELPTQPKHKIKGPFAPKQFK